MDAAPLSPEYAHPDVTLRILLNTVIQAATANHWSQNQRWNLFLIILVLIQNSQKLRLRRKKWFVQGHMARPWVSHGTCGPTKPLHFTSPGRRHNWHKTLRERGKNLNFHHDHEKSAYTSTKTRQGSSYHPTKKKTWGFWGQRKQHAKSWVKGWGKSVCDNGRVLKLCFSNGTNHWLFIF